MCVVTRCNYQLQRMSPKLEDLVSKITFHIVGCGAGVSRLLKGGNLLSAAEFIRRAANAIPTVWMRGGDMA